jgi:hypothetical protein
VGLNSHTPGKIKCPSKVGAIFSVDNNILKLKINAGAEMENFRREWRVRGKWLYNPTPGTFLGVRVVRAKSKNVRDRLNGEAASKKSRFRCRVRDLG